MQDCVSSSIRNSGWLSGRLLRRAYVLLRQRPCASAGRLGTPVSGSKRPIPNWGKKLKSWIKKAWFLTGYYNHKCYQIFPETSWKCDFPHSQTGFIFDQLFMPIFIHSPFGMLSCDCRPVPLLQSSPIFNYATIICCGNSSIRKQSSFPYSYPE